MDVSVPTNLTKAELREQIDQLTSQLQCLGEQRLNVLNKLPVPDDQIVFIKKQLTTIDAEYAALNAQIDAYMHAFYNDNNKPSCPPDNNTIFEQASTLAFEILTPERTVVGSGFFVTPTCAVSAMRSFAAHNLDLDAPVLCVLNGHKFHMVVSHRSVADGFVILRLPSREQITKDTLSLPPTTVGAIRPFPLGTQARPKLGKCLVPTFHRVSGVSGQSNANANANAHSQGHSVLCLEEGVVTRVDADGRHAMFSANVCRSDAGFAIVLCDGKVVGMFVRAYTDPSNVLEFDVRKRLEDKILAGNGKLKVEVVIDELEALFDAVVETLSTAKSQVNSMLLLSHIAQYIN